MANAAVERIDFKKLISILSTHRRPHESTLVVATVVVVDEVLSECLQAQTPVLVGSNKQSTITGVRDSEAKHRLCTLNSM